MKLNRSYSKWILQISYIILSGLMVAGCTTNLDKAEKEVANQEKQLEDKKKQGIKENANKQQAVLEHREPDNQQDDKKKPNIIIGNRKQMDGSESATKIEYEEKEKENSSNGIIYMTPPKNSQDVIDIEVKDNKDVINLEKDNEDRGNIDKEFD